MYIVDKIKKFINKVSGEDKKIRERLGLIEHDFEAQKDTIKKLQEELELAKQIIQDNKEHICTAENVISQILREPLDWYDPNELPEGQRRDYYHKAQAILENDVWINEKKHVEAFLAKWNLENALGKEDLVATRMTMTGIRLIEDHLKAIPNPDHKNIEEDIYDYEEEIYK